jgi:predicted transcriptional regulator
LTKLTEKIKSSNFSFRLDDNLRDELDRISKKRVMSSAALAREAIIHYLHKIQVDEELELLGKTELGQLPFLINSLKTEEGNTELKRRFIEGYKDEDEKSL